MIFYYASPGDLTETVCQEDRTTQVCLPSGGILVVEPVDARQMRVVGLISTNPMDYLNPDFQPGNVLNVHLEPKNRS
ncbi:MAG: hypothetical protein GXX09_10080 [Syntrophomonadaceae bacterium]|nr:hypothetical protein [Syntrophomonadaceae bacterium]